MGNEAYYWPGGRGRGGRSVSDRKGRVKSGGVLVTGKGGSGAKEC